MLDTISEEKELLYDVVQYFIEVPASSYHGHSVPILKRMFLPRQFTFFESGEDFISISQKFVHEKDIRRSNKYANTLETSLIKLNKKLPGEIN